MNSVVLVAFVAFGAVIWIRGAKRRREKWLRRLNLTGSWMSQDGKGQSLEFVDGLDGGSVRRNSSELGKQSGEWRLDGHILTMTFAGGDAERFDLTYYGPGKIGLESAPGSRVYYQKTPANVVPLHKRA